MLKEFVWMIAGGLAVVLVYGLSRLASWRRESSAIVPLFPSCDWPDEALDRFADEALNDPDYHDEDFV